MPPYENDPNTKVIETFPCTKCGSDDRFMEGIAEREREKGNIPKDLPAPLEIKEQVLMNPSVSPIAGMMRPAGLAFFDVCLKCGTFYCYMVAESKAVLGMKQPQPGTPGQGLPRPRTFQ